MKRFWSRVNKRGPMHPVLRTRCWLWTASCTRDGYGHFWFEGRYVRAPRMSWFLTYGKWPESLALHKCDHRLCVRPTHLFEGTVAVNIADRVTKGRSAKGEVHGLAKLTAADVLAIRVSTENAAQLATKYGVRTTTIRCARSGKTWAWLLLSLFGG